MQLMSLKSVAPGSLAEQGTKGGGATLTSLLTECHSFNTSIEKKAFSHSTFEGRDSQNHPLSEDLSCWSGSGHLASVSATGGVQKGTKGLTNRPAQHVRHYFGHLLLCTSPAGGQVERQHQRACSVKAARQLTWVVLRILGAPKQHGKCTGIGCYSATGSPPADCTSTSVKGGG